MLEFCLSVKLKFTQIFEIVFPLNYFILDNEEFVLRNIEIINTMKTKTTSKSSQLSNLNVRVYYGFYFGNTHICHFK